MYQMLVIVGHLGRDPEMRYTPSGAAVCHFSVATSRTCPAGDGELKKETTWFKVTAWGRLAENCNHYLQKGSKVLIEGRLISDPATGGPKVFARQDGSCGAAYEVNAATVKFLTPRGEREVLEDLAAAGVPVEDISF